MRGQVSMEYLLVVGFTLLLIAPLLVLFAQNNAQLQESFMQAQARRAANTLLSSAERVYYAGPPSKEAVRITIPRGVREFEIEQNAITFRVRIPSEQEITVFTDITLIPAQLSPVQGEQEFNVEATVAGVRINETS